MFSVTLFSVSWNLTSNDVKNATFAAMNMINIQNVDVLIGAVYTDSKSIALISRLQEFFTIHLKLFYAMKKNRNIPS
jgi:hypothetical protein